MKIVCDRQRRQNNNTERLTAPEMSQSHRQPLRATEKPPRATSRKKKKTSHHRYLVVGQGVKEHIAPPRAMRTGSSYLRLTKTERVTRLRKGIDKRCEQTLAAVDFFFFWHRPKRPGPIARCHVLAKEAGFVATIRSRVWPRRPGRTRVLLQSDRSKLSILPILSFFALRLHISITIYLSILAPFFQNSPCAHD